MRKPVVRRRALSIERSGARLTQVVRGWIDAGWLPSRLARRSGERLVSAKALRGVKAFDKVKLKLSAATKRKTKRSKE